MKTTKRQLIGLIIASTMGIMYAQDIHFTMPQYFPLTLNPAMSGANNDLSGNIIYRNQWKSVADPFKTIGGSIDGRVKRSQSGYFAMGLKFYNDNTGDLSLKTNDVSINLAYHLKLQQGHRLGLGIYGGFIQRSINMANGKWSAQYDQITGQYNPALSSTEDFSGNNIAVLDAGVGMVYSYAKSERYMRGNDQRRWNVGFSAFHVNRPQASFLKGGNDRMNIRYVAFANADFGIPNSNLCFVPMFVYQIQGTQSELLIGGSLKYILQEESKYTGLKKGSAFSVGGVYRNGDALAMNFVFEYDKYLIGAVYDFNLSSLKTVSKGRGAMEIFIRYNLPNPFLKEESRARLD
jgi:type IX secretion system PorP/SprF family membrane protein